MMARISVVLPHPFRPTIPIRSPDSTENETPSSRTRVPIVYLRLVTESKGMSDVGWGMADVERRGRVGETVRG